VKIIKKNKKNDSFHAHDDTRASQHWFEGLYHCASCLHGQITFYIDLCGGFSSKTRPISEVEEKIEI